MSMDRTEALETIAAARKKGETADLYGAERWADKAVTA